MNKKYLSLTVLALILAGLLSGMTAFAEISDIPYTSPVSLDSYFTTDYFIKSTDTDEELIASMGQGIGGTQWYNADTLLNALSENGEYVSQNVRYKFGNLESDGKNVILMTNDVTIPLSGAYLDSLYIVGAGKSYSQNGDELKYIINYSDGTSDAVSSVAFDYWGAPQKTDTADEVLFDCKRYVCRYKKVDGVETTELERFVYNDKANIYLFKLPVTAKKRAQSVTLKANSYVSVMALTEVYETTSEMASYINENSSCYKEITDDNKTAALEFADYAEFALQNGVTADDITDYETVSTIKKRIRANIRKSYPVDMTSYFTNDYFMKGTDTTESRELSKEQGMGGTQWMDGDALEALKAENGIITAGGIDYKFGSLDNNDLNARLLTEDVTVTLSGASRSALYVTAAEKIMGAKALTYSVAYTDGTKDPTSSFDVAYWASETTDGTLIMKGKRQIYRLQNGEWTYLTYADANNYSTVYAYEIPVNPEKKVASITLKKSAQDNIAVFGITEASETVGELSARVDAYLNKFSVENIADYTVGQLNELFSYIAFARENGVTDSDYNSAKEKALKEAFNDIYEEFEPIDLTQYFDCDMFMKEDDVNKVKGSKMDSIFFESEAVINAQGSDGLVEANGIKYKFGDLTELNNNAFGMFKAGEDTEHNVYDKEITLKGNYVDRFSLIAARRDNNNQQNIKYTITYEDESVDTGFVAINKFNAEIADLTPIVKGYQIRYDWNENRPGYWKVNDKGWELYTYLYSYDIPANPSKKAVSIKLGETAWSSDIFVFALTEVYPSANTIKAELNNIPSSVSEITADNIEYAKNIDAWIYLANKKGIAFPLDDNTVSAIKEMVSRIKNGLLCENGIKTPSDSGISFSADVYNYTKYAIDVNVIIAEYDGNTLKNINIVKNSVLVSNDKQTVNGTLFGTGADTQIKVMFWGKNLSPFADIQ